MTDGDRKVLTDLLACCRAWEPAVCVMGNVRAGDAAQALERVLGEPHKEPRLRSVSRLAKS